MTDESIHDRLRFAQNCLKRFDDIDSSTTDALKDEVDFLRKAVLSSKSEIIDSKEHLKSARRSFPRYLLQAICILADLNSVNP